MRTTWNGSLTFGLVSIPVGLAPATKPAARQSDVSFRLLHRECLTPIKQKRWCPKHDRELAPDEIVKGWEASKGQFVIVEEAELETLEARDDSRSIEISRFVPVEEIDSIWRDRSYFLVPGATAAQRRPYRLLLEAMRDTGTGALGRFVRSGRESLCLVRARGDSLVLETLYLADDVYSDAEITEAVGTAEVKAPELELAHQIIDSLEGVVRPEDADEHLPARPEGAARGQARRRRAAAPGRARGTGGTGGRPARGAQGERRGGEDGRRRQAGREGQEAGGEGRPRNHGRAPPSRRRAHVRRERALRAQGVSRASGGDTLSASGRPRQAGCATGSPLAWS